MRGFVLKSILIVLFLNSIAISENKGAIQSIESLLGAVKGTAPAPIINSDSPDLKCGTHVSVAINGLKSSGIELPASMLEARPDYTPRSFGSVHFLVHYADTGAHQPYQVNVDTLPADGIPDFVNRVAEIFEEVYAVETGDTAIGNLGYNGPPSDNAQGGDNRYDVYLVNLGAGYFGYTIPEGGVGQYQVPSFINLENDFSQTGYSSDPVTAVRITAAHEFFHAIQFGYDALEFDYDNVLDPNTYKPWWFEASAVWAEEMVYDYINDYTNYLRYFFDYPWMSLGTFSYTPGDPRAFHPYAASVWPIFLTEKYDAGIIRRIWEGCATVPGYNALIITNNELVQRSSSLSKSFLEFSVWNYYTGSRAEPLNYYTEGVSFDLMNVTATIPVPGLNAVAIGDYLNPPEHLAANYVVVQTGSSFGGLKINFDGQDITGAGWHTGVLGYAAGAGDWLDMSVNPSTGSGSLDWYNWNSYNEIVIIPTVSGTTPYYISYPYTGTVAYDSTLVGNIVYVWPGDLDNNGIVDEQDILPLANYWHETGSARQTVSYAWGPVANLLWTATPAATYADADGNGIVDIRDFLSICLNWNYIHNSAYKIGTSLDRVEIDIKSKRPVLELIYQEVKDAESGPRHKIRSYLERILGIEVPDGFSLTQNYPNPFNAVTSIRFEIPEESHVRLEIYNLLGQRVVTLVDDNMTAGAHTAIWDGRGDSGLAAASGIYMYRLEISGSSFIRKMTLLK